VSSLEAFKATPTHYLGPHSLLPLLLSPKAENRAPNAVVSLATVVRTPHRIIAHQTLHPAPHCIALHYHHVGLVVELRYRVCCPVSFRWSSVTMAGAQASSWSTLTEVVSLPSRSCLGVPVAYSCCNPSKSKLYRAHSVGTGHDTVHARHCRPRARVRSLHAHAFFGQFNRCLGLWGSSSCCVLDGTASRSFTGAKHCGLAAVGTAPPWRHRQFLWPTGLGSLRAGLSDPSDAS
jgi:hypothetical protein